MKKRKKNPISEKIAGISKALINLKFKWPSLYNLKTQIQMITFKR